MPLAYEIVDWQRYEVADSRKCKVMQWVAVPINQDGLGYIELVTRPDGVRTIGGWLLILQLAARCPKRGLLVSDGGRILGAREIALKTRANEEDIKACLDTLCEVGWIRQVESAGHHPDAIRTPSGLQDRTGQDKTLQPPNPLTGEPAAPERRGRPKRKPVVDNPPTLVEVEAFVVEVSGSIPAQEFIDANARAGWTYGKGRNLVVDWKAHYRTWERARVAKTQQPKASPEQEAEWARIAKGEEP